MIDKEFYTLLPTRGAIVFPSQDLAIEIGREKSIQSIEYAKEHNLNVFVTSQIDTTIDDPQIEDLYEVGTVCQIVSFRSKQDHLKVIFRGLYRALITKNFIIDDINAVEADILNEVILDNTNLDDLTTKALASFNLLASKYGRGQFPIGQFLHIDNHIASILADTFAQLYVLDLNVKEDFLKECAIDKRLNMVIDYVQRESELDKIEQELNAKVKESIDENQRDFYLKEKLRAIKDELSQSDEGYSDIDDLKQKVENNPYPEHVKKKALEEIKRYEMMPPSAGESGVIRNYLDWLLDVPWFEKTEDNNDLNKAKKILDEDHYGLDKVKQRILEYLAVKQMTNSLKSPIICLVGPPGVGKTSLAKSIARALDRKFVKISLGGVKDEAEIRGHRKTYLGSMPGRIIEGMKKAGVTNPVFLIDEIDKLGNDYKGDPSSAMLEVLDPEQNNAFSDHYLEEPYDLSDVLFVCTANYAENIPSPLLDRLEIIELSSYTELEKLNIAKKHLLAKQLLANGLKANQFSIDDDVMLYIIRHYTREAGVRELERTIGSLARKSVLAILNDNKKSIKVSKKLVNTWLGKEKYDYGMKEKKDQVGVVTGLAYTAFGGDILQIEVNYFEGKGQLIVTGKLGEVMVESCKIALDYVKANASKYNIDPNFFEKHDIHIHVPEGAVPKDGPSAGVTITTAIISSITGRAVPKDLAMTGEVTLTGNVLPIGGLKEKSLAANRSGINTILIPKANVKDLDDLPELVRNEINFIPCNTVNQVISKALL